MILTITPLILALPLLVSAGAVVSDPNNPPHQSESGQAGYNDCVHRGDSSGAMCQTAWIQSLEDFCLFAPPNPNTNIGDSERYEVAWCTKPGHGTRLIPAGAISGAHVVQTPHYIQVTGVGDLTKLNIQRGDEGGELDPHGADGNGNPIGGLLLGSPNGQTIQYTEWTEFISDSQFCIRACYPGPDAYRYCQHVYDVMGCDWNMPANYDAGTFEECQGDDVAEPMGVYQKNGGLSTWHQGVSPTPAAQPVPRSSNCRNDATVGGQPYSEPAQPQAAAATPAAAPVSPLSFERAKRQAAHRVGGSH